MRPILCLVLLALSGLGACETGAACTLIGCVDGVTINWSRAAASDRGTITADGVAYPFDCAAPTAMVSCTGTGLRFNRTPATLRIDLTTGAGTRSASFTPQYTESRPNGPGCDPVCRNATVTVP